MTQVSNADGKIWLALKSRLTQWTECKMMMPSEIYEPTAMTSYVITQNVTTESGDALPIQVECGIPFTGFLNLSVLVPINWGFDAHIGLAGRLADHFPNGARYKYSDVSVMINGRSRVLGGVDLNAPWNRLEVQIPWKAWG